ncbi:hypothetical protein ID0475_13650 [Helicobacter pylori]
MSNSCSNQNHNQKGDAKNQNNESCQKKIAKTKLINATLTTNIKTIKSKG